MLYPGEYLAQCQFKIVCVGLAINKGYIRERDWLRSLSVTL
jgi:hypothetical protein